MCDALQCRNVLPGFAPPFPRAWSLAAPMFVVLLKEAELPVKALALCLRPRALTSFPVVGVFNLSAAC